MTTQTVSPTVTASAAESQEVRFQTEQVFTVAGGHFVHDGFSAFLPPLLPLIQERLGAGYAGAGSLVILTQLPSLLNPFIGYLADRISLRYFIILAPGITGTLMSLIGLMSNYFMFAILLLAAGLSMAAFHAPAPAMVGRLAGKRVGAGMSIFMASGELGRTVGPVVAVAALGWWGLAGIWRLAFISWAVSAILYWRLHTVSAQPTGSRQSDLRSIAPQLRLIFGALAGVMVPKMFMVVAITTFLPTFMTDALGASLWLGAASLTILEGAGVVGALATGTLSDRIGRRGILLILLTLAPILLLAFLYTSGVLSVVLLIGLGLTAISQTPVNMAIVQDNFPQNRAVANGIFMAMNFVIRASAIAIVGAWADRFGLQNAFLWSALVAFLSIPAVFWLPKSSTHTLNL
jgi:FSR family fosmidomycin resistance protein-like MFS transporter